MKLKPAALLLVLACGAPAVAAPATKLFAVTITTGPTWDIAKPASEQKFFREHSANLARLRAENLSVLGGRYGEKGLVLIRAADEAAARAELAKDPSMTAGVFQATVEEYRPFQHGDTRPPLATPEIAVVRAALAAYNTRNAAAVAAHYADDIKWFSVAGEKTSLEGEGRAAVEKWLAGYFQSLPDVRAEIAGVTQTGPHVSFRERVTWTARDGTRRAQSALGIYEVRDGKIARAWYFPAAREAVPAAK